MDGGNTMVERVYRVAFAFCGVGDVLYRSLFTVRGAHDGVMEHLRERVALPGGEVSHAG